MVLIYLLRKVVAKGVKVKAYKSAKTEHKGAKETHKQRKGAKNFDQRKAYKQTNIIKNIKHKRKV